MRKAFTTLLLLGASAVVAAPTAQRMWEVSPQGGADMPTSQALATNEVMYWNTARRSGGAQACSFDTVTSQTVCTSAATGSFDQPWVPAAGAELHPLNSAFAFSSANVLSATQYTEVVYHQTQTSTKAATRYSWRVTAESVVSLAPLNHFSVALRYARRAAAPGEFQDTIAIRSLANANFTVLWSETDRHTHGAAMPAEAEAVISMEGSTFMYVSQNGQTAQLRARMANGTLQFAMAPPCGIDPATGFVGIRKVSYSKLDTGEVLQAAILSGRNSTFPNGTILCRVSHHTGHVEGTPVVFSTIKTVNHVGGGDGQIVVSGYNAAETVDTVGLFDATSGQLRWEQTRPVADAGSGPSIHSGVVFFQSGNVLVSRGLSFGGVEQRSNISCARKPAATGSRIYCVQSSTPATLTAFSPMMNEVIWTTPAEWQYGPIAIPGSLTDTIVVVTKSGQLVGFDTAFPQPAAPADKSGSDGAVTAVIVILVLVILGVAAAAAWFYKTRGGFNFARSRQALVNESGDAPVSTPKANHDLYGAA